MSFWKELQRQMNEEFQRQMDQYCFDILNNSFLSEMSTNDEPKPQPILERKREWYHADQGQHKDCWRKSRPVYTPPDKVPEECRSCPSDEWYSKGIVIRDKNTKQIVDREDARNSSRK